MSSRDINDILIHQIKQHLQNLPGDPLEVDKFTIFRVPEHIREKNKELYMPRMVSIGPYYHGHYALQAMEKHKWCYLRDYLSRNSSNSIEYCISELRGLESSARRCYFEEVKLQSDEFIKMMLLDGCFIIEFLIKWYWGTPDAIFDVGLSLLICTDLIPNGGEENTSLCFRRRINWTNERVPRTIPSATELQEAGIIFKSRKSENILDIKFHNGILEIPFISIEDTRRSRLLNLVSFEQCDSKLGMDMTSYASFMGSLFKTGKDVTLLQEKGIMDNLLPTNEELVSFFNRLSECSYLDYDTHYLKELLIEVNSVDGINSESTGLDFICSPHAVEVETEKAPSKKLTARRQRITGGAFLQCTPPPPTAIESPSKLLLQTSESQIHLFFFSQLLKWEVESSKPSMYDHRMWQISDYPFKNCKTDTKLLVESVESQDFCGSQFKSEINVGFQLKPLNVALS
ncbi:hypothetical protein LUZ62_084006 [Rhynchospora pubera]|uniref:Uncharacterized protein n=1 Tax=Rhynchospora pubera TaxID=906938 RepID=A0AAV8C291_9POAL|nr:hypothetical protein LUZ62_084006 [Rhynchospora pubera]